MVYKKDENFRWNHKIFKPVSHLSENVRKGRYLLRCIGSCPCLPRRPHAIMAAGPLGLGLGKGMIAAPIGLVGNGLIGNGLIANRVIGNGILANGVIAGNGILTNRMLANGMLANGVIGGHGIVGAPLAIGTCLIGGPVGLGLGLGKAIL
ncbi:hypothetical protein CDAR_278601 [Caerostris darwini]|uniref:Uncharacterized protein n=1 Tax=Caerostris darwini TaxID=1538125 RepID=A0AAV4WPK1_9ARAC|nr:hypothetical protein CDAR_278601 [Caerostris darwini]